MDTLTKKMFLKSYLIFFLIFFLLLFSESNVEAKFIKKITVESFSDPVDWEKSFKPGKFFSLMLENSLTDSGVFQMVRLKKVELNVINNFVMSPLLLSITEANSSFWVLAKLNPSIIMSLISGLSGFFV